MKKFRTLSIYAFTLFLNAAISFAGFSILTHYLDEIDFGIINLYTAFTVFLTPFIAVGTPFILSVDYFKMDSKAFQKHFTNASLIPLAACLVFTLIIFTFYPWLQGLLKLNFFFTATLPLACLMIVWNEIMLNLFRNKEQASLFAGYSIGKNLLEVALSLFLVLGIGYGWKGRLGSNFISLAAAMLVLIFLVHRWQLLKGEKNRPTVITLALAGLPFIPERLAIFVLGYSDRFFIDHFQGIGAVGHYGAGAQIAAIVNLAIITLNNTFYPGIYRRLSASDVDYIGIRKIVLTFIGLSLLISVVVAISIPVFFHYFIGPDFQPGKIFALYLTTGSAFWAIYNVFIAILLHLKRNKVIMLISLGGMICSLAINLFTVPFFGAIGAAYTNVLVYFLMAAVTITMVHKYFDLRKLFF